MSVLAAALISFFAMMLLTIHLSRTTMRRIAGYALVFDIMLHAGVLYMFMGTSTLGLLQAELSAIMATVSLRAYRLCLGYEKLTAKGWVRYTGIFTK